MGLHIQELEVLVLHLTEKGTVMHASYIYMYIVFKKIITLEKTTQGLDDKSSFLYCVLLCMEKDI